MADTAKKIPDSRTIAKRYENFEQQIKTTGQAVEQRKRLWEALSDYVHAQGGWVISRPGIKEIRIEIPKNSSLPTKLVELGYSPRHINTCTRIQLGKIVPVDVVEISLPTSPLPGK
jgi:hypothetical protein